MSAYPITATVVVGNPRPGSRTRTAAEALAARLAERTGAAWAPDETIELAELGLSVTGTPIPAVNRAQARLTASQIVLVATPVYKASYTGLLKLFLDQLPGSALREAVAIPVTVSASPAHRLLAEAQLRPVLAELGASLPVPSLALEEPELSEIDALTEDWVHRNGRLVTSAAFARQQVSEVLA